MNKFLKQLCDSANKPSRIIVGLMSGTSLDGLDIALCKISGSGFSTKVEVLKFETNAYAEDFKEDIKRVFSKRQIDLEKLTLLHAKVGLVHADAILKALSKWNCKAEDVDFIASHGQTIYHAPQRLHGDSNYPNATLQIGDADHIAVKTGIITLSDFRQKHVAAGGEGAPLALYGDCILFSSSEENRILLNIGGISNFTFLPIDQTSDIICSDLGPGNTLMDNLAKKYFNIPYDESGIIASRGTVIKALLDELLSSTFFSAPFPKTTGPELFNLFYLNSVLEKTEVKHASGEDLIATVTEFTAKAISRGLKNIVLESPLTSIYVSGGGSHNNYLMKRLQELLPNGKIRAMQTLGINPDAKEAVLFAVLANETICGSAIETGAGPKVMMGKISLPE